MYCLSLYRIVVAEDWILELYEVFEDIVELNNAAGHSVCFSELKSIYCLIFRGWWRCQGINSSYKFTKRQYPFNYADSD